MANVSSPLANAGTALYHDGLAAHRRFSGTTAEPEKGLIVVPRKSALKKGSKSLGPGAARAARTNSDAVAFTKLQVPLPLHPLLYDADHHAHHNHNYTNPTNASSAPPAHPHTPVCHLLPNVRAATAATAVEATNTHRHAHRTYAHLRCQIEAGENG